ncbi:MAG: hypothetical protein IKO68_06575 [Oscillospiraceae bacterium]|nr:hypothetical protein [Oscillospiraceae bacterium]
METEAQPVNMVKEVFSQKTNPRLESKVKMAHPAKLFRERLQDTRLPKKAMMAALGLQFPALLQQNGM